MKLFLSVIYPINAQIFKKELEQNLNENSFYPPTLFWNNIKLLDSQIEEFFYSKSDKSEGKKDSAFFISKKIKLGMFQKRQNKEVFFCLNNVYCVKFDDNYKIDKIKDYFSKHIIKDKKKLLQKRIFLFGYYVVEERIHTQIVNEINNFLKDFFELNQEQIQELESNQNSVRKIFFNNEKDIIYYSINSRDEIGFHKRTTFYKFFMKAYKISQIVFYTNFINYYFKKRSFLLSFFYDWKNNTSNYSDLFIKRKIIDNIILYIRALFYLFFQIQDYKDFVGQLLSRLFNYNDYSLLYKEYNIKEFNIDSKEEEDPLFNYNKVINLWNNIDVYVIGIIGLILVILSFLFK